LKDQKQAGFDYAEGVKQEMTIRIEKQVQMLENLLDDKKNMQAQIEQLQEKLRETTSGSEKQAKVMEDRLQVEIRKNKEAWVASEKVRKERWEKDKVQEIRA